jgi:hypothetical protein
MLCFEKHELSHIWKQIKLLKLYIETEVGTFLLRHIEMCALDLSGPSAGAGRELRHLHFLTLLLWKGFPQSFDPIRGSKHFLTLILWKGFSQSFNPIRGSKHYRKTICHRVLYIGHTATP